MILLQLNSSLFSILTDEDLQVMQKDLAAQIMYHETAEGPQYYKEKEFLEIARNEYALVTMEINKRLENSQSLKSE